MFFSSVNYYLFINNCSFFIKITATTPPKKATIKFRKSNLKFMLPDCTIDTGSKPNLPNNLIKKILPKTPTMVFPTIPNEYFLKIKPVVFAPIIPVKILNNEIKVAVIMRN